MPSGYFLSAFSLALLALAGAVPPGGAHDEGGAGDSAPRMREDRLPIRITAERDFLLPSSGVRSGDGTPSNPYIISGWKIRFEHTALGLPYQEAIHIAGVSSHYVIRDVSAESVESGYAIRLMSPRGVRLENVDVMARGAGILVQGPAHIVLADVNATMVEQAALQAFGLGFVDLVNGSYGSRASVAISLTGVGSFNVTGTTVLAGPAGGIRASETALFVSGARFLPGPGFTRSAMVSVADARIGSVRDSAAEAPAGECFQFARVALLSVEDVTARGCDTAFQLVESDGARLTGLDANRNRGRGLLCQSSRALDLSFANMTEGGMGLYFAQCPGATLRAVNASQHLGNGLYLQDSDGTRILGGSFSDNVASGIDVRSDDVLIDRATVQRNGEDGIYSSGNGVVITNSTVTDNRRTGIDFRGRGGEVSYNDVQRNPEYGAYISYRDTQVDGNLGPVQRRNFTSLPAGLALMGLGLALLLRRRS